MNLMMNSVPVSPPRAIQVGVVGGGFAGLAAATALKNLGCQVTLFEARDKLAGRVESSSTFVPNRVLEKGAELIGSNHVIWTYAARVLGLGLSVITEDDQYVGERLQLPARLGGRRLSPIEARSLYDSMKRALGDLTLKARAVTDPYNPWLAKNAMVLDRTTLASWITGITSDTLVRTALDFEFANNNAVSTDRQSLLAVLTQIAGGGGSDFWEDTEVYRCENGNDALAAGLADWILRGPSPATIHRSED